MRIVAAFRCSCLCYCCCPPLLPRLHMPHEVLYSYLSGCFCYCCSLLLLRLLLSHAYASVVAVAPATAMSSVEVTSPLQPLLLLLLPRWLLQPLLLPSAMQLLWPLLLPLHLWLVATAAHVVASHNICLGCCYFQRPYPHAGSLPGPMQPAIFEGPCPWFTHPSPTPCMGMG